MLGGVSASLSSPRPVPADLAGLLAFVSGYVDTAVFIHMQGLFVAHVTGNFVLLGATLASQSGGGAEGHYGSVWVQFAALPAFFLVAVFAGLAASQISVNRRLSLLLWLANLAVAMTGGIALFLGTGPWDTGLALALAGAMGMLNAVHRLVPAIGPPFTVMTGNVAALALALAGRMSQAPSATPEPSASGKIMISVCAFAGGCALGALAQSWLGMGSVLLPAILLAGRLMVLR